MTRFRILGQSVEVACEDRAAGIAIRANGEAMAGAAAVGPSSLRYRVERDPATDAYVLSGPSGTAVRAASVGELVFHLEKAVTVALQERRPDLLFLHAAALEFAGSAYVFAGESGAGKSTTAWGLLHHGFGYLSDELAPVDLGALRVDAYPHALCLKQRPPASYPLPVGTLDLGATIHVPVRSLPGGAAATPSPLKGLIFVRYREGPQTPVLRSISAAEGAARLYVSTLNALAHEARGLDAVLRLARQVPCFVLEAGELRATCELVRARLASAA